MKIQLNTDNHIDGTESLEERVTGMIDQQLGRFADRLTRIEVYLSDNNSPIKGGPHDKRCALEARPRDGDPIGASHDDEDVEKAVRGAADKLRTKLDAWVEKQRGY
mgnify:FL=1